MNNRQEFLNKWIKWLDSDIRFGVLPQWEKDNKRELKEFFEELQTDSYFEEIRLSRELAKAIGQEMESYGQVVPHSVMVAYKNLLEHYAREIEASVQ